MDPKPAVLTEQMLEQVAQRFRLLGEPLRLRLLQTLEAGECSVSELAEMLEASQPNISRHLGALHEGGLVARRRDGNSIYYSISDPVVFQLCSLVCSSVQRHVRVKLDALGPRE